MQEINRTLTYMRSPLHLEEDKKWYAVSTFFRSEKKVLEHLEKKSIKAYLPLISKVRRYQRKIKRYNVPIINNYVFVFIGKKDVNKVLETEQVIKFIKSGNDMVAIPQYEIDILRKIEGRDIDIEVGGLNYEVGDEVEISQGGLTGLRGRLICKAGKKKFTVELDHLGVCLRINVDIKLIRKLDIFNKVTA